MMADKPLVGLSTGRWQEMFGDEEALRLAKAAGADAVDLDLLLNDENLYLKSEDEIFSHFEKVAKTAASLDMIISQTHGRICGYRNDPEFDAGQKRLAYLDLQATKILGCKHCAMHGPSYIHHDINTDPVILRDLAFRNFTDFLPMAKEAGVKIATETFGDATRTFDSSGRTCIDFFGSAQEFISIYDRIRKETAYGDWFCVCMDTGHTNKSYRFPGQPSPAEMIRRLGKNIEILHLHDNDCMTDQHKVPRSGNIDWKDVMAALRETGYNGVYNMELVLGYFGQAPEMMFAYAEFAVKVMRNMLEEYK